MLLLLVLSLDQLPELVVTLGTLGKMRGDHKRQTDGWPGLQGQGTRAALTRGQQTFSRLMVFPQTYTSWAMCFKNTGTQSSASLEMST